ncbi:MAG: HTH domain-containing protein [Bacteroidetes bacterium]|nr:HTH domain-containing protein [Bacteroidota bacterium]
MPDDVKSVKLLKILMLIAGNRKYTASEIAEKFGCSKRSVFRYIRQIEAAGFVVDNNNGYKLEKNFAERQLKEILHFSEDEVFLFINSIKNIEGNSKLQKRLLRKLNCFYHLKVFEGIRENAALEKIDVLSRSISEGRQVVLHNYRSGNSNIIESRQVEPFKFTPEYDSVVAYDVNSEMVKLFKVDRMDYVEENGRLWKFAKHHSDCITDAFGIAGIKISKSISFQLTLKAYNLLTEEFPSTKKHIAECRGSYILKIKVCGYEGVGRFVLGLPMDISNIEPLSFRKYLRELNSKREF